MTSVKPATSPKSRAANTIPGALSTPAKLPTVLTRRAMDTGALSYNCVITLVFLLMRYFASDTFMKGYSKGYEGELSAHQQSIYDNCFKSKAAAAPAKASPLFKPKGS